MALPVATYKTIKERTDQVLFKDRKSKFYGFAFPIEEENEVKPLLESLKNAFPSAGHFCYAWQLGIDNLRYRANDDGEPKNSAGMPIYGQIQKFELTNILVVVIRIYGGTKLGVSGLINAYRTTSRMAIEAASIESRVVEIKMQLDFGYPLMSKVMHVLKIWNANIIVQELKEKCTMIIAVPRNKADLVYKEFEKIYSLTITKL